MTSQSSESLLSHFDAAPLNRRYWVTFVVMAGVFLLDFFDFFLIAFVMSVIGPRWHLTYGEGAIILYGAGIGAIIGSLAWGSLGDRFGRKLLTVTGTFICGISAGLIGFLPTGAWIPLAVLRFFVGFGLAAGVTPALTIVVELTPTRWRTGMTSFYVVFASAGTLLASFTAASLLHAFGWRGVAATGFVALVVGVLVWILVPESVRWLAAKGRFAAARQPCGTLCRQARAVLADDHDLGRLGDRRLWLLPVGADDRRPRTARDAAARRQVFRLCRGYRRRRQARRLRDRAADGPARPRHSVQVRGGRPACGRRIFPCRHARRVAAVRDPGRRLGLLCRRRFLQSRPLYGRAVRGQAWLALLRSRPGRQRRRQDPRASGLGAARRQQQHHCAAGHGGGGPSGLRVSRRDHAGRRAGLRLSRRRNARPADRPRRRGGGAAGACQSPLGRRRPARSGAARPPLGRRSPRGCGGGGIRPVMP